ncbi:MAG: DNA gyrase subunit A [Bacilli bacterium]|nr:DNA gyrase subunit A [Bacilli bacterium]
MDEDKSLNQLLEAAEEDAKEVDNPEEKIEEGHEDIDIHVANTDFSGYFHERDSLTENNIVNEVSTSFLEYSMSVITSRALPDLRDGLKPVNRRILWSMFESGYTPDKPHRKSAKTVGEVMGNYHPHGDSSIYEAMVRMAQDFNQRYMLVDGHGNFGNIEGDGAAAMRYTESRLAKLSLELLRDIRKDTIDMTDNFDFTRKEPVVLPSRFPNILVNGTMGIAVGMATNIPPHNLGEVIDGCVAYIDNPDIELDELMKFVKGPDFPTGGIILGNKGIRQAYETGRGGIVIRSKASIEEVGNHSNIIITEVPYGVNTLELKNRVADLVHNKVIDGISDYHTDLKDGVKITITLKKDANPQVVLNNLYKHTNFQVNYGIIFLMLDNGVPRTLGLKAIISKYIDHQKEVIIRRTKFELNEDEKRVHILEGLKIALDHIDEVISIVRGALDDDEARTKLMQRFGLTEIQSNSILEMRIRRLTGLEREKIESELNDLLKEIDRLKSILASNQKVLDIIKEEMLDIKKRFADERRTHIDMTAIEYIEDESLIPEQNIMIALTNKGYIKRITLDTFKTQNRGGVGVKGMSTNEEDFVDQLLNLSTHDYILFFTNKGKVYRMKGYEVPEFSRQSKGLPIINLLQIEKEEKVKFFIKVSQEEESKYLLFVTKNGIVKRTALNEFDNIRNNGKICITMKENDELVSVRKTSGHDMILLGSSSGRMVKTSETNVRVMGRTACGVRGINLDGYDCIGAEIATDNDKILIVTEKGYGKQTQVSDYRETSRGSKGVKALNVTEKNGNLVAFKLVHENSDVLIITDTGMLIRLPLDQISTLGRVTQGVRLIHLKDNQLVSTISIVDHDSDEEVTEQVINNESSASLKEE